MVKDGMTLEQVKAARPTKEFDQRFALENVGHNEIVSTDAWYGIMYNEAKNRATPARAMAILLVRVIGLFAIVAHWRVKFKTREARLQRRRIVAQQGLAHDLDRREPLLHKRGMKFLQ